ncbi:MAG: xanthine dehydrogenase family protein molybdopterin-binding subunit [Candidatus Rokuibacteriota bacterium]|nr:MAG: xanthine dehydrogenase family protein molybdopterin-binding subunit [Candidatus Rokubacteria bacterium]
MHDATTTRRDFLKNTGALIVSFSVAGPLAEASAQTAPAAKPVALDDVDSFLALASNGRVTVYTGKVDLGTGTRTSLRQIVAEELDVPLEWITLIEGDTATTPDQGPTWGSLTIQVGGVQIRQAAATARKALIDHAAQRLGVTPEALQVKYGVIRIKSDPTRNVGYGELIGDHEFHLKVDKNAPLKSPSEYTVVGTSVPRVDIPAKVTGEWTYMHDVRVPGMLHARVVRPPAIGAELQGVDESSVSGINGVRKVVRKGSFLAVVADSEWAAVKAAGQLKTTWSSWAGLPEMDKVYEHVRSTPINKDEVTITRGDPKAALAGAAKRLNATYEFAIHTHGSIGPSCAVAEWKNDQLTVWTASQATHVLRRDLAMTFGVPADKIRCLYFDGAGCYGRNGHEDAAADAALLAREMGRPVRVQWMRHDEHGWDPKGPPTLVDISGGLDASGTVVAWQSEFWIPKVTLITEGVPFVAATLADLPRKPTLNPGNVFQNSAPSYTFANVHAVCHRLETTPFRPSWIRTPGRMQNTFANEAFMDELAAVAGVDPVEFRLRHMNDARGAAVLKAAATKAKWETRPSPRKASGGGVGRGRGVTYVKYENVRTYVAAVAEVEVERPSGAIRVTRVTVAQDCGQIINPDGVRAQLEGNVIQTVSRTLKEELKWDRSRVTSVDWQSYPILTFPEVPVVQSELINRPADPPWGVGEPSAAVVPSAISNAVFDATGVRMRTVPFTPERFKAAAKAQS